MTTVSDRNSWDTSTGHSFFLLACFLSLPMLFIAVKSKSFTLKLSAREDKKCPNNFDWDCSCTRVVDDREIIVRTANKVI